MSARAITRTDAALALLAILAIVAALLMPWGDAGAQQLKPGVGLPGVPRADFERSWCQQHRPGGCSATAPPTFNCALCPSSGWLGYYAEFFPRAQSMLRGCWELDTWGTRATHDGVQTPAEFDWAQVAVPRSSTPYRECWYEREHLGGAPERAIVIASEADARNWSFVVDAAKAAGAWREGVFAYKGFDPVSGGWRAGGAWPVWVDNRTAVTPVPAPVPVPVPPPPSPAPCEPLETSQFADLCSRPIHGLGDDLAACATKAQEPRNAGSRLRALWDLVCEPEPEPEPVPVPDPPPPVRTCFCAQVKFIPGIESTGALTAEIGPVGECPCPEVTL